MNAKPPRDARADYYWTSVREQGKRYETFHWPSVELLLGLVHTYDVLAAKVARTIGRHGLSLSGFNVLNILNRSDEKTLNQREIGDLLLVSRANMTGLLGGLVKRGFVERLDDRADRRARRVRITKAGQKLLEAVLPGHYREVSGYFANLSADEKKNLNRLLAKIRERAAGTEKGRR